MALPYVEYREQQLKEAGQQLFYPSHSIDDLLSLLDHVGKLLSKVDQTPEKSMADALKPSIEALVQDSLLNHSDVNVKVSVAFCLSEITRITAPDLPYDNDDQMKDVLQLIVSSFEHLADHSSQSYKKRTSILETVSKVRSCVIMLDLECNALIIEMFEHFLRSVRDYHLDSVYSMMETIMVMVLKESEEIHVEMLKPLLACVKQDSEGVLPVARKLAEGVLLKSAEKLRSYLMPAILSLGDTLDDYSEVVATICEEKTSAMIEINDEDASGLQSDEESKLARGLSDHTDQVVKAGGHAEVIDLTIDRSPKSVMSNGDVTGNEETLADQELIKKPEEDDINQKNLNKKDTDDSDADKQSKLEEQTSKERGKKDDMVITSTEPGVVFNHKRASEETSDQNAKKSRISEVAGGTAQFSEKHFSKEPLPTFEGVIDSSELSVLKESKESDQVASDHFPLGDKDVMGPPSNQMFLPDERVKHMGPSGVADRLGWMANGSATFFSHAAESIRALERRVSDHEAEVRTLKCQVARDAVTIDDLQNMCEQHSKRYAELCAQHTAKMKLYESRVDESDSLVTTKNIENSQLKKQLDELVIRDKASIEKISILEKEVANLKFLDKQTKLSFGPRAVDAERRAMKVEIKTETENSE